MNACVFATLLAAFGQVSAPAPSPYPDAQSNPTFLNGSIRPKGGNDIRISAEVEGVLVKLPVHEGSRIADGQVIALIDDRQVQAAVRVAKITEEAAIEQANDTIEERYAIAAAAVAKVDWQKSLRANQIRATAISEMEILEKELVHKRSILQIEKARKDQVLAGKDAAVKTAELEAAQINLERHTIRATLDGDVQQLFFHEGEWVNPGDPILRVVKLDVLEVDCFVDARLYDPVDLKDRKVTVRVDLAGEKEAAVEGRVVYTDQIVQSNGTYLVRAEVQNKREGQFWLLRPGLPAEVTIHLTDEPPGTGRQAEIPLP